MRYREITQTKPKATTAHSLAPSQPLLQLTILNFGITPLTYSYSYTSLPVGSSTRLLHNTETVKCSFDLSLAVAVQSCHTGRRGL